jgi:Transposase DDE domain
MSQGKRSPKKRAEKREQQRRNSHRTTNKESLAALLAWFLPNDDIFAKLRFHGNTKWVPGSLVFLALYWSWSEARNLTDAFTEALGYCRTISACSPLSTYQGFMGALVQWSPTFINLLCPLLQDCMQEIGGKFWQIFGWVPIAFDGSRSTAPRTKSNEEAFCAPNYGKGKTARYRKKKSKGMRRKKNQKNKAQPQQPQAWITMMWHMGLRLPWTWRLGPSNSSERAHVMDMVSVGKFPKNTLFCGDAGFVGYPLWSAILQRGTHFLVRVGANVSLLSQSTDYRLLKNGIVLCWPKAMMLTNQPPLRLRLVKTRIGKTKVWLLTSVLDSADLTPQQMIKLYKMRWGIEVEFRGLKQTLDRAKLRCRNDKRLLAELDWSIMAMAVAELFALKEQLSNERPTSVKDLKTPDPVKRSLANTMRAIRHCLRNLNEVPPRGQNLPNQLRLAVTDSYQRKAPKQARYRPPNPDKKPLGDPQLRKLTAAEKKKLGDLTEKRAA